eukprot:13778739-Alexandrium_andersonii.AAC.1
MATPSYEYCSLLMLPLTRASNNPVPTGRAWEMPTSARFQPGVAASEGRLRHKGPELRRLSA